jgi:hypothetical protein
MTRGRVVFVLIAVLVFVGWQNLSMPADKSAVLHIPPGVRNQDTFVTLWVVEGHQNLWIRAETKRRIWLDYLEDYPLVELTRGGHTGGYRARTLYDPDTKAYVDTMFRKKYGRADQFRAIVMRRDSVPIRLERP